MTSPKATSPVTTMSSQPSTPAAAVARSAAARTLLADRASRRHLVGERVGAGPRTLPAADPDDRAVAESAQGHQRRVHVGGLAVVHPQDPVVIEHGLEAMGHRVEVTHRTGGGVVRRAGGAG